MQLPSLTSMKLKATFAVAPRPHPAANFYGLADLGRVLSGFDTNPFGWNPFGWAHA